MDSVHNFSVSEEDGRKNMLKQLIKMCAINNI